MGGSFTTRDLVAEDRHRHVSIHFEVLPLGTPAFCPKSCFTRVRHQTGFAGLTVETCEVDVRGESFPERN